MLKLSKLADYALMVIQTLGSDRNQRLTGRGLTEVTGLPQPTVRKVLLQLLQGGLIISTPGAKGGYDVAKPLSEITVLMVLRAVDGDWAMTACDSHDADASSLCTYKDFCQLKHGWRVVNAWLMQMLNSISVEDMAKGLHNHPLNGLMQAPFRQVKEGIT